MRVIENRTVFHPHAGKAGDLKETAIRKLAPRLPPRQQPIALLVVELCDGRLIGPLL
jgi:hypothetical protein